MSLSFYEWRPMTGSILRPRWLPLVMCLVLGTTSLATAQLPPDPNYVREEIFPSYQDFKDELNSIVNLADPVERDTQLDAFWTMLQDAGQVPYAQDNQVAFMYRGAGATVSWPGDFNGWNPSSPSWQGAQQGATDLVLLEKTFPSDARLDYKIVSTAPGFSTRQIRCRCGAASGRTASCACRTTCFPRKRSARRACRRETSPAISRLRAPISVTTSIIESTHQPGTTNKTLATLPVAYVTDGHEYSADHLGSMVVVLDNLIDAGLIQPMMAVFIDPRDPVSGTNRRGSEYTGNPAFADFVADELVAEVDASFRSLASPSGRTILGTSFGGVNSAYFGGTRSDVFENIAVQSPSNFSSVFNLYATQSLQDEVDIFLTAGTIGDGSGGPTLLRCSRRAVTTTRSSRPTRAIPGAIGGPCSMTSDQSRRTHACAGTSNLWPGSGGHGVGHATSTSILAVLIFSPGNNNSAAASCHWRLRNSSPSRHQLPSYCSG